MVEVSWTILGAVVVFLIGSGAILVAEVLKERDHLRDICKFLKGQRDEARQEICLNEATSWERDPRAVAEGRGWDCFKEED